MGGRKATFVGSEPEPKKKTARKKPAGKAAEITAAVEPEDVEVKTLALQQEEVRSRKLAARGKRASAKIRPLHSKRYRAVEEKYDRSLSYDLPQAISLARELSYSKFPGTVELHARLVKPKKGGEEAGFRTVLTLPHGSGKTKKVAIATDELLEAIAAGKLDFDVLVASPAMMPKLAKVAKILGPKGLMPSPKSGTISEKPEELVGEFAKGRLEARADKDHNVHLPVGKVSQSEAELTTNIEAVLRALPKSRIQSATLAATMSPPVRLKLDTVKAFK